MTPKRILDVSVSLAGLILLSPVIVLVGLLVYLFHGYPVLFRQQRPGLHGAPFLMYKFRSMTNETDGAGLLLPPAQRLTRFGRFLRSSSLDELPELFNVLRGEMSLVGPRPLRMEYLDRYTPEQMRRHEVKPGITGWAQVNGRNAIDWESKFALDLWYVDNHSLWLDLRIMVATVKMVLSREGIAPEGEAVMTEFTGLTAEDEGRSNDSPS